VAIRWAVLPGQSPNIPSGEGFTASFGQGAVELELGAELARRIVEVADRHGSGY
jgi:hypothetical protein